MYNPIKDMANPPSEQSMMLADIMLEEKNKCIKKYRPRLFGLIGQYSISRQKATAHKEIRAFLDSLELSGNLIGTFRLIAGKIAVCEMLMAYSESHELARCTIDDERRMLLRDLHHGRATPEDVRDRFGYYAKLPFDVNARRYRDMGDDELRRLAAKHADYSCGRQGDENDFSMYACLREELRHRAIELASMLNE